MKLLADLFGELAEAVEHDHYVPAPGEPGDHIYVPGYGPCQVWSNGDVKGYRSRWVVPIDPHHVSAVLVYWLPSGAVKVAAKWES